MTEIRLFDSHLHLSDQVFEEDRSEVLQRARDAGVSELVTVASDPADARRAIDLAGASPGVWATVGLHPHEAAAFSDELLAELDELAAPRFGIITGFQSLLTELEALRRLDLGETPPAGPLRFTKSGP